MFAETGNNVTCVDIDEEKVKKLSSVRSPFMNRVLKNYFYEIRKKDAYILPLSLKKELKMHRLFSLHCPHRPVKMEVQI